ncbi:hypothetical protein [Clostridium tyrobutyricum]|uniref:hypothetical protein n=1 Tax=Clostridium tyrobutyricum TaxID=1519 RepID=UPI00189C5FC9|nr:hypothetical protein [Clostridium tyrobutyricum]
MFTLDKVRGGLTDVVVCSFRDLLENQCYNEIYEAVNEFVQDNPSSLDCSTRCVQSPDEEATQWFKIKCTATLDNGLHNLNTKEVSLYTKYDKVQKKCLSDTLVPIIYKEELDEMAEDFLSRYYPEILKQPMAIDPEELAKRMRLTIV